MSIQFLCHLLRTGCLINHNCNFSSFWFLLQPNGKLQESPKDHRQKGEVKRFVGRAGRGNSSIPTAPQSKVAPTGHNIHSIIAVPGHCQCCEWHQLWSIQKTGATYLLKVAQIHKDLFLEGTVPRDESFSERASLRESCSNPSHGILSATSVRDSPLVTPTQHDHTVNQLSEAT